MRQCLLTEVNADGFAWCHRLGEVDGDGAGPAPAVEEAHPGAQILEEKRGPCPRAAGEHGAAPGVGGPASLNRDKSTCLYRGI